MVGSRSNMVSGRWLIGLLVFFAVRRAKRWDIRYPVIGAQSFPICIQLLFSHWPFGASVLEPEEQQGKRNDLSSK